MTLLLVAPFLLLSTGAGRSAEPVAVRHASAAPVRDAEDRAEADRLLALAQCGACHALPPDANGLAGRPMAPDLDRGREQRSRAEVRAFLAAPHVERPRTRMPDLLAGLQPEARDGAAAALAAYLVPEEAPEAATGDVLDFAVVERGRQLYHSVGCVACHGAFEAPGGLDTPLIAFEDPLAVSETSLALRAFAPASAWDDAPPLDRVGGRRSVEALAAFLADPLERRPYGAMPDLGLSTGEARALAEYLRFEAAAREGRIVEDAVPGLRFQYFEGDFHEEGPPAFDVLAPVREGVVQDLAALPPHRADGFGFRYRGELRVPAPGEWSFSVASDDGAWIWIDGAPVVANGGIHPVQEASGRVRLEAGTHSIEVRYFEGAGGEALDVRWEGPGVPRQTIPPAALSARGLTVRPAAGPAWGREGARQGDLASRGAALFETLGCGACHAAPGRAAGRDPLVPAWSAAAVAAGRGCLSDAPPAGVPRYPAALVAEAGPLRRAADVAAEGSLALDDAGLVHTTLATLRCTACHAREGVGGPAPARARHFRAEEGVDLGDEGRLPPQLDLVGWKLRDAWLEEVLAEGRKVRPYMLTRMPRFGLGNVGHLGASLRALDRPADEPEPPVFSKPAVEHGRLLMGTDGLGCVQCHDLAGYEGLGVPAVDLATAHERLRWPWFRALLEDPGALNMNTRMPAFWTADGRSPVDELYGADPGPQVEAIWTFLSLGDAVPLPQGLVVPEGTYELTPLEAPIAVGVFWEGASARTVLVGFPERLHVAFDVENSRLDAAWRGRFFDARGTWHARAGSLERPPTDDVLRLPAGAPLAVLGDEGAAWPEAVGRAAGWRARGREYDAERVPAFRYANVALGMRVRERARPEVRRDGVWLVRELEVDSPVEGPPLWLRAAVAKQIGGDEAGAFETSDGVRILVRRPGGGEGPGVAGVGGSSLRVRPGSEGEELLVLVPRGRAVRVEVLMTWSVSMESVR